MILDDTELESYIKTFYGYGTWSTPFWFVGMEENGGYTIEDTMRCKNNWKAHGTDLFDIETHHRSKRQTFNK